MDINDSAISAAVHKTLVSDSRTQVGQVQTPGAASTQQDSTKTTQPTTDVDPAALQDAVEKLSEFLTTVSNNSLKISIDNDLSRVVLQVVNRENDETIRQIPSEEVLDLMKRMRDLSEEFFGDAKGLLLENKA